MTAASPIIGIVILLPILAGIPATAETADERVRALAAELRCVVCQNQSLLDSDADLAKDMRALIRERVTAGDTDEAIVDAVDIEDGLIVPVVRDADRLDLALSRAVGEAAQRTPEKNRCRGRGRPKYSRNVLPSYARHRMPWRCSSGTTLSTKFSRPAGR